MPTDRQIRVQGVGASVAIQSALRANVSNWYGATFKPVENPIDAVSFKRGDSGVWLCVVKRYNSATGERQVCFGHGGDLIEALISANGIIAAGKWTTDKPWSGRT